MKSKLAKAALLATMLTPACHPAQLVQPKPTPPPTLPKRPLLEPKPEKQIIYGTIQEAKTALLRQIGAKKEGVFKEPFTLDISAAKCVPLPKANSEKMHKGLAGDWARIEMERIDNYTSQVVANKCADAVANVKGEIKRVCCAKVK